MVDDERLLSHRIGFFCLVAALVGVFAALEETTNPRRAELILGYFGAALVLFACHLWLTDRRAR